MRERDEVEVERGDGEGRWRWWGAARGVRSAGEAGSGGMADG